MTNITRSAKSGNEWTDNELKAYEIKITFQDAPAFFGETLLPPPAVNQELLTALTADDAVSDIVYNLLTQLDLAMMPSEQEESAVTDFAVALFRSLGYIRRPRAVRTRKELRFIVCGEHKCARPNICIIDRNTNDIVLVAQEDKKFGGGITNAMKLSRNSFFN